MDNDVIFTPLKFRNLEVKNRLFRSNIAGRFDNYDGSGTYVRINWERQFAKGGFGTIISSFVPISTQGRIVPGYAMINADDKIPFWREVGEAVHEYGTKFIMQLSHSGRQQDITGIETLEKKKGLSPKIAGRVSSTDKGDPFHGLQCRAMTTAEVKQTVQDFIQGARRAREAGLDGVELHGAHGYLLTQFLSSGINDRKDEYGGSLENRTRIVLEIIEGIRKEVGNDFHVQMKISGIDWNNYPIPWEKKGNKLEESIKQCQMIEEAGADAMHVSVGALFPHPLNPYGGFDVEVAKRTYDGMISSGDRAFRNFLMFRYRPLRPLFLYLWNRVKKKTGQPLEGHNIEAARAVKAAVKVPVIVTGGFQRGSIIRDGINSGAMDGVSIARSAVANPDLPNQLMSGKEAPDRPCTYCNRCMFEVIENPLGCYDDSRFDTYEEMIANIMKVYHPSPYDPKPTEHIS